MSKEEEKDLFKENINIPGRKTYEEVFDKSTLKTLYKLMSDGIIYILDFPISTGKEAKVFKGEQKDGTDVAVKIMRVNTAVFGKYRKYIQGDHRFKDVGNGRDLVFSWTKKEFSNLKEMKDNDIRAPDPIAFSKNVLVMEYLEDEGNPAPELKDVRFSPDNMKIIYEDIVSSYERLYNRAGLVHGDLSEYNILFSNGYPYLIDVSQAVPLNHPFADELFDRDLGNIARYFGNQGIETSKEKIKSKIVGDNEGE